MTELAQKQREFIAAELNDRVTTDKAGIDIYTTFYGALFLYYYQLSPTPLKYGSPLANELRLVQRELVDVDADSHIYRMVDGIFVHEPPVNIYRYDKTQLLFMQDTVLLDPVLSRLSDESVHMDPIVTKLSFVEFEKSQGLLLKLIELGWQLRKILKPKYRIKLGVILAEMIKKYIWLVLSVLPNKKFTPLDIYPIVTKKMI